MMRKLVTPLLAMPIAFFAVSGVAAAEPTDYPVPPAADADISTGEAGETAYAYADGFLPGETVTYTIDGPAIGGGAGQSVPLKMETVSGTVVAGSDGSVVIAFTPELPGTYTVTFEGQTSGLVASVSGVVTADGGAGGTPDEDEGTAGVVIGVNNGTVIVNNGTIIIGNGFVAGEGATVTVVYVNGDVETYEAVADNNGTINVNTTPKHAGKTIYKVQGHESGAWGTETIWVESETEGWTEVAGTTTAAYVSGGSGYTSALADTGASVAAPLAIGGTALVAGLGLLFFGTRGAIRRRGGHVSS
jgi:hypothetical protein